jgi:ribulose bisphosphate carboxylase small subunit
VERASADDVRAEIAACVAASPDESVKVDRYDAPRQRQRIAFVARRWRERPG